MKNRGMSHVNHAASGGQTNLLSAISAAPNPYTNTSKVISTFKPHFLSMSQQQKHDDDGNRLYNCLHCQRLQYQVICESCLEEKDCTVTQTWQCEHCHHKQADTDHDGGMALDSVYDAYDSCVRCGEEELRLVHITLA